MLALAVILPLIAASLWIYSSSEAAFRYQRTVRIAQNDRAGLLIVFLKAESDVRALAATRQAGFGAALRRQEADFAVLASRLHADLVSLRLRGGEALLRDERTADGRWTKVVAAPAVRRSGASGTHLLQGIDSAVARRLFADDRGVRALLDRAAETAQAREQLFLRRILITGIALVCITAVILSGMLAARGDAERRSIRQRTLYEEERRVSELLQSALVPEYLPSAEGLQLQGRYVPAADRLVGGDWYEAVQLQAGRVLLVIGDVAGHGVAAAVVMNRVRQAILSAAVRETDPAALLRSANRALVRAGVGMVTVGCCVLDARDETLVYATAGHPPPVIVLPDGTASFLHCGAPPLGIVRELDVVSESCAIAPGAMLVLYTDGITEEHRDVVRGECLLLAAAREAREADDAAASIFERIVPNGRPRDDVALLVARVPSRPMWAAVAAGDHIFRSRS